MKPGDRIAIKAAGTRKMDLPFDANGKTVSKMTIRARGTILHNHGDGKIVDVDWDDSFEVKDWYFFTARPTVWEVRTDQDYEHREAALQLIDFVWNDASQDYGWFMTERWSDDAEAVFFR